MRYAFAVALVVSVVAGLVALRPQESESAQHLMRVYAVGGGAGGDAGVQYVELRMASTFQNLVNGHDICFYDENGDPWARLTFSSNVGNTEDESSILVGSAAMDAAWPAGSPDFTFGAGSTTAIAGGADASAPVPVPAGKVAFGNDLATDPSQMCDGSFSQFDSVAYGTGYSGPVEHGTKFGQDLPMAGTQAITLTGDVCNPCPRDNSTDYALAAAEPRNNGGDSGPLEPNGEVTPTPSPTPEPTATPTPGPTPTPTPTPDGTPTPTPEPTDVPGVELVWGDLDCNGSVDAIDALKTLQWVAAIDFTQEEGCPEAGGQTGIATASVVEMAWGDVNCDGDVNPVDALQVLRHLAALGTQREPGCPEIGGDVQTAPLPARSR